MAEIRNWFLYDCRTNISTRESMKLKETNLQNTKISRY